ncbi:hypothetical protein [Butyrivibrio sp. AE3006]|uniref:hypothetical protein n=1 Tax=Butyrivibrio sp. AE3006 TaxID=1280673 RepID=UPI00041F9A11|nr:hypothetical protein [Butyrivibrio sp. AE3006]
MGNHNINKTYIEKALLLLLLLLILANSCIFASQKKGYFLDEGCTFLTSNADVIKFDSLQTLIKQYKHAPVYFVMDKWTGYEEIMDFYTTKNSGSFGFLDVCYSQAYDVHPPLYFACINIISSLFPNLDLKWVGYLVNIIFLLATCICIYNICVLVLGTDNKIPAMAAMLYYGLSYEFTNTATYCRMYAMLGFWLTMLLFVTIRFVKNDFLCNKHFLFWHCCAIFCAMLTQYFAAFYILPIFIISLLLLIIKKKSVKNYVQSNLITGILYLLLWPSSVFHLLFTNRGRDVLTNVIDMNLQSRIKDYIYLLSCSLFSGMNKSMCIFFVIALILGVISIWNYRKRNIVEKSDTDYQNCSIYILLCIPAILYFVIVSALSPWIVDRYQMPIMPIFSILIVLVIHKFLKSFIKNRIIIYVLLLALPLILCYRWESKYEPRYLYNDSQRSEYIANYKMYDAIVVSRKPNDLFVEIPINYPHSNYLSTFESGIDKAIHSISEIHHPFVMYLYKNCDAEIAEYLQKSGFSCEKLDYSADSYDIYFVK